MLKKNICSICAWRENCQKRFSAPKDGTFVCNEFTKDLTIKDNEIKEETSKVKDDKKEN